MPSKNYKNLVIDFLTAHSSENVSRDELIKATGISKPRLSEILNSIRDDGYTIITPPRSGIVRLESNDNENILSTIKDSDIRQWLILYILSCYGAMTFRELIIKMMNAREHDSADSELLKNGEVSAYDDNNLIKSIRKNKASEYLSEDEIDVAADFISVTTLRKDLSALRKQGLVDMSNGERIKYSISSNAPYFIPASDDSLYDFCRTFEENSTTISESKPAQQAFVKIKTLIDYDGAETPQRRFGRQNQINTELLRKLDNFLIFPYKTNKLRITYHYRDTLREVLFSVALIFYSVETDAFYTIGENYTTCSPDTIRLDAIESIEVSDERNDIFNSKLNLAKYTEMYGEMFAAGFEAKRHHVKVMYQNFSNTDERFNALKANRPKAKIKPIKDKPDGCIYDFIYEDDLRGLDDFARFLRSFGYSVLALEPPELKEKMTSSFNRRLKKYAALEDNSNE